MYDALWDGEFKKHRCLPCWRGLESKVSVRYGRQCERERKGKKRCDENLVRVNFPRDRPGGSFNLWAIPVSHTLC